MIQIYTKSDCVQCDQTKKVLDGRGIAYVVIDVTEDESAAAELRAKGIRGMPFVVTPEEEWTGFRPDKLRNINQ